MYTLAEFWDMLARHDWAYEMSDDHRHYTAGRESSERIRVVMRNADDPEPYKELHKAFSDWGWGRTKEKPVRPA
jgi:hypothetical protein